MNEAAIKGALDDALAFSLTLWAEGRGEPIEGRIAVASVIRNRVRAARFGGTTYRAVVLAPWQFSCWNPGSDENHVRLMEHATALLSHETPRWSPLEAAIYAECAWIVRGVMDGHVRDRVKRATHYYNPKAMDPPGRVPHWAMGRKVAAIVGSHLFYADIP